MTQKLKNSALLCMATIGITLAVNFHPAINKAQAHHDSTYAPVRPSDHQNNVGWRDWYDWNFRNPNRPRPTIIPVGPPTGFGQGGIVTDYEHFVVPDQNPMSWEDASRLCDHDGGRLVWRRDRKVCVSN